MQMDGTEDRNVQALAGTWYYLDPSSSNTTGPVDPYQLAGLLDSGLITTESMVWAQGQTEWLPLQNHADLYAQVYHISSANASALPALAKVPNTDAEPSRQEVQGVSAIQAPDSELAKFNAEMVALGEAEGEIQEGGLQDASRQESPPPEDKEFEDDDGTVYVWDSSLRKFQPKADGAPPVNYGVEDMTFEADEEQQPAYAVPEEQDEEEKNSDAEEVIPAELEEKKVPEKPTVAPTPQPQSQPQANGKKRKAEDVLQREANKMQRAKEQEEASKKWFDLKVNTSVYVTGLPDDITEQELAERFAKFGVLKPGEDGAPRVKVYRDKATQMPKGDGLVTFLYEPSVKLACNLADGDHFRPDMGRTMKVQPAKFEMHGDQYVAKKKGNKNKNTKAKAKVAEKVLGWGGFDDTLKPSQVTVILENLFRPEDFVEEPSLIKDMQADIRTECVKIGAIEKVRVFPGNANGVASVRFKTVEAAEECIGKMKDRYFGGRKLDAHMWDGHTNYNTKLKESEEQIAARRARFAQEIESQDVEKEEPPEPE